MVTASAHVDTDVSVSAEIDRPPTNSFVRWSRVESSLASATRTVMFPTTAETKEHHRRKARNVYRGATSSGPGPVE